MAHRLTRFLGFVLALSGAAVWAAENLPDPTRPPPGIGDDAAGKAAAGAPSAVETAPGLTSIIIPARGSAIAATAIIGGKTVRVGDSIGDKRVVRITENAVVVRGLQGKETMLLTPAVEKKMLMGGRLKGRARAEKP